MVSAVPVEVKNKTDRRLRMFGETRQRFAAAVVGLALLGLAGRTQAGTEFQFCCQCRCGSTVQCVGIPTPSQCPDVCTISPMDDQACMFEVSPNPCSTLIDECQSRVGAPALRTSGLMAVALLLAGFGTWRVARRKRA